MCNNIAEGSDSYSRKEFMQIFNFARRSRIMRMLIYYNFE